MDKRNTNPNELWEEMGSLDEEDLPHVLIKLFTSYEEMLKRDPKSSEAMDFFQKLQIISEGLDADVEPDDIL